MSSLSGKVQTVLGLVGPSKLGRTLTHEHLTMTFDCSYYPPPPCREIQKNPYSHRENLQLNQETEAIKEELWRSFGGKHNHWDQLRCADLEADFAEETGVHITSGTGFYMDVTHSSETRAMSVGQLTDVLVNEILHAADGTSIKCGVTGETGCSWPLTESERRVLRATAHAQAQLGCPVIIHPGRNRRAPFQIIRVLQEAGADTSETSYVTPR
ncbi:hypothetical protein EI555_010337 [Monodon monoceros]|uniref:N-acetyltaurine hydrolase n=1 Tax=Monodon monoceros TaxID=40151 RepID=A0A4U1EFF9_MONMO|nr:hypothetical protein EI555_010337 [Monodon monoceros]